MFDIKSALRIAQHCDTIPTDITFSFVNENKSGKCGEIRAHRYCLALASPVFNALFYGKWSQVPNAVEITNASQKNFKHIIDFCYGDNLLNSGIDKKTEEELKELCDLADFYHLPGLKELVTKSKSSIPEIKIPDDVTFQIVDEIKDHVVGIQNKQFISANKYRLALASNVFAARFFGSLSESNHNNLPIKGTTYDAFSTMIKFINNEPLELNKKTMKELWNIMDQAEMYDIPGLIILVRTAMGKFPLTDDNVVKIVQISEKYRQFEDAYKIMILRCANYLHDNVMIDVTTTMDFIRKFPDTSPEFLIAMRLLKMKPKDPDMIRYPCGHLHGRGGNFPLYCNGVRNYISIEVIPQEDDGNCQVEE